MTTVYERNPPGGPGVHVLAIGVGQYPHLIDGTGPLAKNPLGLEQLTSPPISVQRFINYFLAPLLQAPDVGFVNDATPLGSVEGLASAVAPVSITAPTGNVNLESATRDNIQTAYERWLTRMGAHNANIGVFYFCGHGLMVADHYLLAEDFGRSNANPWENAFDISNTLLAVKREVKGALYFFIDACREISRAKALTLGANPLALSAVDVNKPVTSESHTLLQAAGEGKLAFATEGKVSRFTDALVTALSGYCGVKEPGSATWNVDGETIAAAVRKLLEQGNKKTTRRQVNEQHIGGPSVPLLRLTTPPMVKVELDLAPELMRQICEMYLLSAKGQRRDHQGAQGVFTVEVPRGIYEIGAKAVAAQFQPVCFVDQDLIPPLFSLTMQAQP